MQTPALQRFSNAVHYVPVRTSQSKTPTAPLHGENVTHIAPRKNTCINGAGKEHKLDTTP